MVKRLSIHLVVQIGVLVVIGAMAGFCALISMGGIGGTAMGVAPEFSFGLVEAIVCPEGTLDVYSEQQSYHRPGESEPHVECVSADGSREDVLIPAILAVLGSTFAIAFVVFFVPVFLPLAVLAWILTRKTIKAQQSRVA